MQKLENKLQNYKSITPTKQSLLSALVLPLLILWNVYGSFLLSLQTLVQLSHKVFDPKKEKEIYCLLAAAQNKNKTNPKYNNNNNKKL